MIEVNKNIMEEEVMMQIGDTLVSLDLAERFFCCDLDTCKASAVSTEMRVLL